jgi:hypothetical protein
MTSETTASIGTHAVTLTLCLALAACSTLAPPPSPQPRTSRVPPSAPAPLPAPGSEPFAEAERAPLPGESRDAGPEPNAASTVLLERGRNERAAGSHAEAAASIERALRIDPNNPLLWIELGEIKLAQGDREQAEMMARKALTLAGSDRSITARAERLVSR